MPTQDNQAYPLSLTALSRAVEVQSSAFESDPFWLYLIPDMDRRKTLLRAVFQPVIRFAILNRQAYVVGNPPDGFAVWNAPQDKIAFNAVIRSGIGIAGLLFRPSFVRLLPRAAPIFSRFEAMQKQYAPDPHYYLQTISVSPDAQGRGLASKLIKPFLEKALAENRSVYTETMTPSNVGLYEHYGFRVMEEYSVPKTDLKMWAFYKTR